jgi:HD-like signal output (HDOD) protein
MNGSFNGKSTPVSPQDEGSRIQPVVSAVRRRILFVDDEPGILDGLRAVLRSMRREWEMVFALGGQTALEQLKNATFDVVVTDMRMPVVDGAEVLRQTKEIQPRAVRIVLSGETDADTALKTVFTAHQFMAKPCDCETLRGVVHRACQLNELVLSDELRALAGDVSMLPAPPRTYLAITNALSDPSCTIKQLGGIVERDPAVCAKVLQIANSAFFGLPRKVSNAAEATSYLGTLTLRNLALAMESAGAAKRANLPISQQQLLDFQCNSLLVGLLGRHWYGNDRRRADEAFVAGMLRDMGHLLLSAQGRKCETHGHASLSAYLLGLWGLPHSVLEPVAFHEEPERVEHDSLEVVDVVHLADRLAAELLPSPFQETSSVLDCDRLVRLGVDLDRLAQLRQDAKTILVQTKELLK